LNSTEENKIQTLVRLGLTLNQAKLYLASLRIGYATAKMLAQNAHIGREEVYRVLPSLQNIGLMKKHIGSPTSYEPVESHEAMSILIGNKSNELSELKTKAVDFVAYSPPVKTKCAVENDSFIMITNLNKALRMIVNAFREASHLCVFTSGYERFITRQNMPEKKEQIREMIRALQRGVKIKAVFDDPADEKEIPLSSFSYNLSKKLVSHPNFEYRYISKRHPGLIAIFDENIMFIETRQGSHVLLPQLWSNNKVLLGVGKAFFESAWESGFSPEKNVV
jgi:sugar-specific transcriptional regulator TrmB